MLNLVITVVGILAACFAATIGIGYMNTDHFTEIDAAQIASTNRFAIREAFAAYRVSNKGALPAVDAGTSAFPTTDLKSYLAMPPQTRYGLTWSYIGDNQGNYYACLSGTSVAKPVFDGFLSVETLDDQTIVASNCAADESDNIFQGEAAFKFKVN